MSIFDERERQELDYAVHPLAELPKGLGQSIDYFDVEGDQASDDRAANVLNGKFAHIETERSLRRWLTSIVGHWRDLCQQSHMTSGQPEQWRRAQVRCQIYDDLVQTIPGMVVKRYGSSVMSN